MNGTLLQYCCYEVFNGLKTSVTGQHFEGLYGMTLKRLYMYITLGRGREIERKGGRREGGKRKEGRREGGKRRGYLTSSLSSIILYMYTNNF